MACEFQLPQQFLCFLCFHLWGGSLHRRTPRESQYLRSGLGRRRRSCFLPLGLKTIHQNLRSGLGWCRRSSFPQLGLATSCSLQLSLGRVLSAPIPWRLQAWFRDMATQSCGLETVAQAILGALKSLQRRSKVGHWQHSSFGTVCQQLASFPTASNFSLPSAPSKNLGFSLFSKKNGQQASKSRLSRSWSNDPVYANPLNYGVLGQSLRFIFFKKTKFSNALPSNFCFSTAPASFQAAAKILPSSFPPILFFI